MRNRHYDLVWNHGTVERKPSWTTKAAYWNRRLRYTATPAALLHNLREKETELRSL